MRFFLVMTAFAGNLLGQTSVPDPWGPITTLGTTGVISMILLWQLQVAKKELENRQHRIDVMQDAMSKEIVPVVTLAMQSQAENTKVMKELSNLVIEELRQWRREFGSG